jgi:hypothetical protein
MDNFLKYVVAAGAGAGILYLIQQNQIEKSLPNPEAAIEEELAKRISSEPKDTYRDSLERYRSSRES